MNREPVITVGTITAIVAAILAFLQSFGVSITDAQQDAIRGLVAVLAPIVLALIARQFVFSPASTRQLVNEAYQAKPDIDPAPQVKL
jgi:hypothetical protein